jgi:hypothetical protein
LTHENIVTKIETNNPKLKDSKKGKGKSQKEDMQLVYRVKESGSFVVKA